MTRTEKATVYLAPGDPPGACLKNAMAEIMSSLDAFPRPLKVKFRISPGTPLTSIGFDRGEPVFSAEGENGIRARFRNRWIAEHPVPLEIKDGLTLKFTPSGPRRVRVG